MQAYGSSRALHGERGGAALHSVMDQPDPARTVPFEARLPAADPVAKLHDVLSAAPVDLCQIADEMRAHPEFEAMVMRLASSLLLSPESSVGTIEEAVVALGTDRLRLLLHIWSLFRKSPGAEQAGERAESKPSSPVNKESSAFPLNGSLHPEALYLATFLRYLGWDSGSSAATSIAAPPMASTGLAAGLFESAELFSNCISLIPLLGADLLKREQVISGALNGSDGKESE
jgi:hypothetical protein